MTTTNDLRTGLIALARRSVSIMTACSNEESTKLHLVLPFLSLLGYDVTDPYEVYPQHTGNIDFVVLRDGAPAIAVDSKRSGCDLAGHRGRLRAYFDSLPEVKLAILSNGTLFELFVDADVPGKMDQEPFLTVDLETIARAGASDDLLDTLYAATRGVFEPEIIAEAAHVQLVKKRLRTFFVEQAKVASEDYCRFVLQRIGVNAASRPVVERYYAPLIRAAFDESLVVPVMARLRANGSIDARSANFPIHRYGERVEATERELAILTHVRRRLAYLADNDVMYEAIDKIGCKDYVGKLLVYYDRERTGRLFDYIEGADGYDKFVFPEPIGEIVTNNLADIDTALKAVFNARVGESAGLTASTSRSARVA